jgi:hypothetical protein
VIEMLKTRTRIAVTALALCAVLVSALPIAAYAATVPPKGKAGVGAGRGAALGGAGQQTLDQRRARLRERIENLLERRKVRFDLVERRLTERIARLRGLADKVKTAGGDVSGVTALLDQAAAHLEKAAADEAKAIEMFKAIPDATDRRAAFAAARAQAKIAGQDIRDTREDMRAAIAQLKTVVKGLKDTQ